MREWTLIARDDRSDTWAMPILPHGYSGTLIRVDVVELHPSCVMGSPPLRRVVATTLSDCGATLKELMGT